MAIQCTNCGIQPRPNAKFCHACGTPIATTSLPSTLPLGGPPPVATSNPQSPPLAPSTPKLAAATEAINVQTSYTPQTPQTYHAPPRPMPIDQPKKKSGHALKIILITFALLAVVGIAAILVGVRWANRAADRLRREGLNTRDFGVSINKDDITEEVMGVPPYPNAVAETPIILRGNSNRGSGSFGTFTFTTKDDVGKVADFYKEKLGEDAEVSDVREGGNRTVTLTRNQENAHTNIVIKEAGNKTQIVITNAVGKPNNARIPGRNEAQRMREEADRMKQEAERIQREVERSLPPPLPPPPGR